MKTIFGNPKGESVELTALMCFYQNKIIKEMKASLDANFRNVLSISSSINGHVLSQNRKINAMDKKFSLCFPKGGVIILRYIPVLSLAKCVKQ